MRSKIAVKGHPLHPLLVTLPVGMFVLALVADIVYIRDFTKAEAMDDEQLKHLAIIAYACYGSFDLAAHCLFRLAERKAVVPEAVERFMNSVRTGAGAV